MPDIWVVMSTIRPAEAVRTTNLVLKTSANLAVAVNNQLDVFNALKKIQKHNPDRFILELGSYIGQIDAVNQVYGNVRNLDPSNNILLVPIPDDMVLKYPGWCEAFAGCYNSLEDGVGMLSGWDGHGVSGFVGLTAKYCDIYHKGWLHCPEYFHWWVDHESKEIACQHSKFYRCDGAQAYHELKDNQKNISNPNWGRDHSTFTRRRGLKFSYEGIEEAPWRYWK